MTNLEKLQNWLAEQADGEREHTYGVKIETSDNPGWILRIDLHETILENIVLPPFSCENIENDWYFFKVENKVFTAADDLSKLDFLLGEFLSVIENGLAEHEKNAQK
jgi:hypothetical protein